MSFFDRKRNASWDPFGDLDWDNPFGCSLFGDSTLFSRAFGDLDRVFDMAEKGELPAAGKGGPYIYARSTVVGPDGKPYHREVKNFEGELPGVGDTLFGTSLSAPGQAVLTEGEGVQEPYHELQTKDEQLLVTVDLPGLTKQDIELDTRSLSLHLKGRSKELDRHYQLDLELPQRVLPAKARARFNNGILEVILPLVKGREKGRKVKIE